MQLLGVSTSASGSSASSRLARMDPAPGDARRRRAPAAFAALTSNGASPTYAASSGFAPSRSSARSSGSGSGLWRSVSSPPTTVSNRCSSGIWCERELDGLAPLRGHDPEPAALILQPNEQVVHPGAADEALVKRLVVRAVDGDELVDAVGSERVHLRLEPGPADGRHQLFVGRLGAEHLLRGMPHRGEDDRAGVDDGAVEVEQNDRKTHGADASRAPCGERSTTARCSPSRACPRPRDPRRGARAPPPRSRGPSTSTACVPSPSPTGPPSTITPSSTSLSMNAACSPQPFCSRRSREESHDCPCVRLTRK